MVNRFATTACAVLVASFCLIPAAVGQAPVMDGFVSDPVTGVVEAPYVAHGITYTQDSVSGAFAGLLYRAEDANNFYFAFEQSVHINDNTYGSGAIGWPLKGKGGKTHSLKDLTQSEHAKVQLTDCAGNTVLDFFLDYASFDGKNGPLVTFGPNGGDGAIFVGNAADITGWGSSLEWNYNKANPAWGDRANSSPARVPTNTYDPGTTADPAFPWIYPLVYEWSVAKSAFPGGCLGSISITEVHNSPLKSANNPVPVPVLTVAKSSNPPSGSTVTAGTTIEYVITYTNTGLAPITNVVITDVIDPHLAQISPADGGVYDAGTRTITWPTIASIGPGDSGSVSFTAVVTPAQNPPLTIYNTAVFNSPDLPTPAETNTTEHHVVAAPEISITKSCPALVYTGDRITYTLQVANTGTAPATGVVVTDTLPPEVTYAGATPSPGSVNGQTLTWNLGTIGAGGTATIQVAADVVAIAGVAVNNAAVTMNETDVVTDNSTSCSSEIFSADVAVSKTCPGSMVAGVGDSYSINASNVGSGPAADVVVTDTLPAGVVYTSAVPPPTTVNGQTLTWNLGTMAGNTSTSISVNVVPVATTGTGTNTVTIATTSPEGGQGAANNSDACSSTFTAADVAIGKTCPVAMVAGTTDGYSLSVANNGTATAKNVVVTDTLPSAVSFVSATPAPSSVNGQTLTWNLGDMAAGASTTIAIQVNVVATSGTATNQATVSTDSVEGGNGAADNAASCGSDVRSPDVRIDKTCPIDMTTGQSAGYTLAVANIGTSDALNVVVTDALPAGTSYLSATPAPSAVNGNTLTWNLGTIAAGGSVNINITVNPTATSGTVTNAASVSLDGVEGGQGAANNNDSCSSNVLSPALALAKSCPADMVAGVQASYTLNLSNGGTTGANDVVVTDTLPSGVAYVSATPAPTSVSGQTLSWSLGTFAAGASTTITILVNPTATSGSSTNNASVTTSSAEGGNGSADNSASCSSNHLAPDMSIGKSCPADMTAGVQASYTLSVENLGSAAAANVVVTDTLPSTVSYVSATPAPTSVNGQTLTWDLGSVAAGASTSITIQVNPTATSGSSTNNASVSTSSVEGGSGSSNNAASCSSNHIAPDIAVTKTCPIDMVAGEGASYTVQVSNGGTATANAVVVSDTLPAAVAYVSATPAPTSVNGQTLTWNLGSLAAGASTTIVIQVNVTATSGTATNNVSATTTSSEGGQGGANNSDSCDSSVLSADVGIVKTCPVSMQTGVANSYTLLATNSGTSTARSVSVTDTLPAGVQFVSSTPAPSAVNGQTLTWDLGDMAPSASTTITIHVNPTATTGSQTNNASIATVSTEGGFGSANNSDSCSSDFLSPDVGVSVGCPAELIAGTAATYTIGARNTGTAPAAGVVLTATLPSGVSYQSATPAPTSISGQTLTWNLGTMAAGATQSFSVTAQVTATSGTGTLSASISTTSSEGGNGATDNTASCESPIKSADVYVAPVCSPSTVGASQSYSFVVNFGNQGTTAAHNAVLTDTVPSGFFANNTFTATSTLGTVSVNGMTVTVTLGSLAAGASGTLTISGTVASTSSVSGTYTNSASLDTSSAQSSGSNDTGSCQVTVTAPALSITKSSTTSTVTRTVTNAATASASEIVEVASTSVSDTVVAASRIAYQLVVTNTGDGTATNVSVVDTLPARVAIVANPDGGTVSGGTVTWSIASLAPGASVTLSLTVETQHP